LKLKTTSLLIAGTLFGAAMLPAQANNEAMADLLKVLRDKGTISAEDYNMLKNAAAADQEKTEAAQAEVKKQVEEATANMPVIETDGKLVIADREGNWEFQPIGRVMWDAISVDNDELHNDDDGEGTELRRARLGFEGKIYDWGYKFEADFAGGDADIKDAFLSYGNKLTDTTKWGVKLGQSQIAYGFNTAASSKYMSFMDRPMYADSTISKARESGIVAEIADKDYRWSLKSSLTNGTLDGGETTGDNETSFAVRGTFVPFMQDAQHMVQVGAGYLTQGSGGDNAFKYEQRLVSHTGPKDLASNIATGYDGSDAYQVDALGIFGSFHVLAEYTDWTADQSGASDLEISGYSVEAGYFLTGESVKWKKGLTSGISPKSSMGAWQIVARFENVESEQSNVAANNDEADKFTVGLNYYPTKNTRLMLNYDKVTDLTIDDVSRNEEPSALKFRAQAYW
jgi:phosphate-selective porin OprO/OprP